MKIKQQVNCNKWTATNTTKLAPISWKDNLVIGGLSRL